MVAPDGEGRWWSSGFHHVIDLHSRFTAAAAAAAGRHLGPLLAVGTAAQSRDHSQMRSK